MRWLLADKPFGYVWTTATRLHTHQEVEESLFSSAPLPLQSLSNAGLADDVLQLPISTHEVPFQTVETILAFEKLARNHKHLRLSNDQLHLIWAQITVRETITAWEAGRRLGWNTRRIEAATRDLRRKRPNVQKFLEKGA